MQSEKERQEVQEDQNSWSPEDSLEPVFTMRAPGPPGILKGLARKYLSTKSEFESAERNVDLPKNSQDSRKTDIFNDSLKGSSIFYGETERGLLLEFGEISAALVGSKPQDINPYTVAWVDGPDDILTDPNDVYRKQLARLDVVSDLDEYLGQIGYDIQLDDQPIWSD